MTVERIFILVIAVIMIGSAFSFIVFVRMKRAARKIGAEDLWHMSSVDGVDIPILESFSGLKWLVPLVFGRNHINPKLVLFPDHLDYKVLFRKSALYRDIASIRSFRSQFYNKVRFVFYDTPAFFTAVFGNEETLQAVLKFLAEKGILPDEKSRL